MGFISQSDLKFITIYDELKLKKPTAKSQRNFYICKKNK